MLRNVLESTQVVWNRLQSAYNNLNTSTLTGAVDVIVVKQRDNTYSCGPFYVKFGKLGILRPSDQHVDIFINGRCIRDLRMRLGPNGEAFFVEEVSDDESIPDVMHYHRKSMLRLGKENLMPRSVSRESQDLKLSVRSYSLPYVRNRDSSQVSRRSRSLSNLTSPSRHNKGKSKKQHWKKPISTFTEGKITKTCSLPTVHEHFSSSHVTFKSRSLDNLTIRSGHTREKNRRWCLKRSSGTLSRNQSSNNEVKVKRKSFSERRFPRNRKDLELLSTDVSSWNASHPSEIYQTMLNNGNDIADCSSAAHCSQYIKCYKRINRLSSDRIRSLNLVEGENEVVYVITTRLQGTVRCTAAIYLWNYYDRLVISDVDGTITKSDVLGHVFPMVGKDWSHRGVSMLYKSIARNGYRFVYLSSRAIGQASITRRYLTSLVQEHHTLPHGPILLSPSSLFLAFHREMIEGRPEIFKIDCLRDLRLLFPEEKNPFYSGFGNRMSDVVTYSTLGIPGCRIFTVAPDGSVHNEKMHLKRSNFQQLSELVDFCFPPLHWQEKINSEDLDLLSDSDDLQNTDANGFWKLELPRVNNQS